MGKEIPACSVEPFDGRDTTSGLHKCERKGNPSEVASQVSSGNKCSHDPQNHRFYKKPLGQKRRFHVIEESIRRIKKNLITPFDYPEFNQLLYNQTKQRKLRSEAREAELSLLLPAIADTVNLVKMELGYFDDGNFINYSYSKYVELTGMSEVRVKRHMLALKKRGLIDVKVLVKELDDGYRTENVIITVSDKIFTLFGLDKQYLEDRERAIRNWNKIQNQVEARERYLELYRAKKIRDEKKPSSLNQTQAHQMSLTVQESLKNIADILVKKVPVRSQGNGVAIRDAINKLMYQGYSIEDASSIVKEKFYPDSS